MEILNQKREENKKVSIEDLKIEINCLKKEIREN